MLRISLYFLAIGVFCLFLADIEISTLNPWLEVQRLLAGVLAPDVTVLYQFRLSLLNTVTFALTGIFFSVAAGAVLAMFYRYRAVRLFCAFTRSIHEIFWAFLFIPVVGLNALCGVLAIAIPYSGIFAKVYTEIFQESDSRPWRALPERSSRLSTFFYGMLPVAYQRLKSYTSYRFECALRSSAVLGFIGLPTLGFHLESAFRQGHYAQAAAMLYFFYLLIATLKYWLKPRLVPLYIIVALVLISPDVHFSGENLLRFFSYEIFPWPMRRDGFLDGSRSLHFSAQEVFHWGLSILKNEGLPGLGNTILLTQLALAGTGLFTLLAFPLASRHFFRRGINRWARLALVVLRTTPEYILAYLFVQLWGPSMLPAVIALLLHNGGILAHLSSHIADQLSLRPDAPRRRTDRYGFEILPRIYGQFLAFLFYRWEVIMRESAILGILGVYTLGFFIDSAIADDRVDKALFLILLTAGVNMIIDMLSQIIRRRIKISHKLMTH